MMYDAVIIGGGISGMTAALLLAKSGSRVLLLESSPQLAPVVRGFSRDGLYFDTGFHYAGGLNKGGVLERFFRHLGLREQLDLQPYASDGFDLFRDPHNKKEFAFPCGYTAAREAFNEHFPAEQEAIQTYLEAIRQECQKLPYLNPELTFDPQQMMGLLHGLTLQQFLDGITANHDLQQRLSLHGLLYGVPPTEMPFTLHASVVAPYFEGTCGIHGGGRQLVRAYTRRLEALGVEIRTGSGASSIELDENEHVAAVLADNGERLACRHCISSVAPRVLLDLLPPGAFRPAYRKRLAGLEETPSAHLVFAACENSSFLDRRNLFLDGTGSPFDALGESGLDTRTLYLAKAHADPHGSERNGLVIICPAEQAETAPWQESTRGQRPKAYSTFKQQVVETICRRVETDCPELGRITPVASSTPLTMRDYSGNPGGGIYGVKHKVEQFNPQPPTRIPGLILTGQSTAAPGILGATLSAYLSCGHLLGHDTLCNEVKACN